jgi:alpha-L-fucosidase
MQDKMSWFRDARYGLFIHWGLYSLLAGLWEGEVISHTAEWIMKNAKIPLDKYRRLGDSFNPVNFDAEEIVKSAERWGMRYLVFTTKHHDGFAMFDSSVSDYNIMHTPFKRDVVKELAEACGKHNMPFGLYYSQMQDWQDPNGDGNTWDFPDKSRKDFRVYFENKVKGQLRELLTNYGPISLLWFDTPYDMPSALCSELVDFVHSLQKDCIINGRIGYGLGDYREMGDNEIPLLAFKGDWETPMTTNNSWGFCSYDHDWIDYRVIVKRLVDVVGRGGNLLLNIGPDSSGCVPAPCTALLDKAGQWLKANGESIYGASAAPDFPYQLPWGGFTYKNKHLYMHIVKYPSYPYELRIVNLKTQARSVHYLKDNKELKFHQSYEIARNEYRLRIMLPKPPQREKEDLEIEVVDIELENEPVIQDLYSFVRS